jgi:hypothetical protein
MRRFPGIAPTGKLHYVTIASSSYAGVARQGFEPRPLLARNSRCDGAHRNAGKKHGERVAIE